MKVKWTRRALKQLKIAQEYIAEDNPIAAQEVAQRIWDATKLLSAQPDMGRLGRVTGTREWVVKKTPYLLAYQVVGDDLRVIAVIHSKQLWPKSFH